MEHAIHRKSLPQIEAIGEKLCEIARMVENERYCVDILAEIRAAKAALDVVENMILGDHLEHCVQAAVNAGDEAERERKIAEVMNVMKRN